MLKKEEEQRKAIEKVCPDMLVPEDHLLRKIDKAVDFEKIYEIVEDFSLSKKPSSDKGSRAFLTGWRFRYLLIPESFFGI